MGVLEAVRGWDAYHGIEPEPVTKEAGRDPLATEAEMVEAQANSYAAEEGSPEPEVVEESEVVKPQEDEWNTAKLDELARADHVALLLEHARHVSGPNDDDGESQSIRTYDSDVPPWWNLLRLHSGYNSRYPSSFSCWNIHQSEKFGPLLALRLIQTLIDGRRNIRSHCQRSQRPQRRGQQS